MIPFQLNMKTGPTPGKIIQLNKPELSLGRDLSNDIVISDADVSRRHARLVQQGEGYLLEDLGSTNGTFVNGERLTAPQALRPGDSVRLGETVEVIFELPGFDSQATVLASHAEAYPPAPPAMPDPVPAPQPVGVAYAPETFIAPEPQPGAPLPTTYVDEPAGPQFQYEPAVPEKPKGKKTGLLIGIGCVVLLCLCAAVVLAGYYWIWPMFQG